MTEIRVEKLLEIIGYLYVENLTLREKLNDQQKKGEQDVKPDS